MNLRINLQTARKITEKFINHFELPKCHVYYVNNLLEDNRGLYFPFIPAQILISSKYKDRLGTLLHELCHHLVEHGYENEDSFHGYQFDLARKRCITWAKTNIDPKLPYNLLLRSKK